MCRNMLTFHEIFSKIKSEEQMFGEIVFIERGTEKVDNNKMELIEMIRENDNPGRALMTATLIVLGYLKQHGSSAEQDVVGLQELC